MGFIFNKQAYLRDPWNFIDFFIVCTGVISLVFQDLIDNDISIIRVLRVLRPLRTVANIKSLKLLLSALFTSLPLLIDTIIILIFVFSIFAIGGLQVFSGKLKQNCFQETTGKALKGWDTLSMLCGGSDSCPNGYLCGKMLSNPNWDTMNFDNFFTSFLQV